MGGFYVGTAGVEILIHGLVAAETFILLLLGGHASLLARVRCDGMFFARSLSHHITLYMSLSLSLSLSLFLSLSLSLSLSQYTAVPLS